MTRHADEFIESLLDLARGRGGRLVCAVGEAHGDGWFWAGVRFRPVRTLCEAVLRCLLAGGYDRVVAFTGHDDKALPDWRIGPNFHLHDESMVWLARGEAAGRRAEAAVPADLLTFGDDSIGEALRQHTAASVNRLLWRSSNRTYWDRLEEYSSRLDAELAQAEAGRRVAVAVDYTFLVPTAQEAATLGAAPLDARRRNAIRAGVSKDVRGTSLDLVLFSEDAAALELTRAQQAGEPPNLSKVVAAQLGEHEWGRQRPTLEGDLPHLCVGPEALTVYASRSPSPTPSRLVSWDGAAEGDGGGGRRTLYDMLRSARLNRKPAAPAPPKDSREVALEFWAALDLRPLRRALDEEIIGQAEAKETVYEIFEGYKAKCARLLAVNHQARKTYGDAAFCLPIVGLFGAAGMGKSTFCEVLIRSLFSDESFGRRIDMAGKSLEVSTIGIAPPYVGSDDPSDLITFSRQTNGLGVVCFDEFTRVQLKQHGSLADTLGPLLQILQERRMEPANVKMKPPGRFFYYANTFFVFSGNVSAPGEPTPEGFHSLASIGPAFATRVTKPLYFKPLSEGDYRQATRASLASAARQWALDFMPDAERYREGQWEIDDRVVDAVEERFRRDTGAAGEPPSLRRLRGLIEDMRFEMALGAGRQNGAERLLLGPEILPPGW